MSQKPNHYYEVYLHGQKKLVDGSLTAELEGKPTSWCVYVRDYEFEGADHWEEAEEIDFDCYNEALEFASSMAQRYDCGIDEF